MKIYNMTTKLLSQSNIEVSFLKIVRFSAFSQLIIMNPKYFSKGKLLNSKLQNGSQFKFYNCNKKMCARLIRIISCSVRPI